MSLWSPETLHVFLGPAEVLAVSRIGWRQRPGLVRRYLVDEVGGEPWQAPMAVFSAALREFGCRRVHVVLSHHFVQYRVLPWRADLSGEAEYRALAQVGFADAFGGLAANWTIGLSDEPPGLPRVAAAVPSDLLTALSAAAAERKAKIAGVRPYLAAVEGLWPLNGAGSTRWLLVVEPGKACAAVRNGETWRWLRHLRLPDDWPHRLSDLLAAESLLAEVEAKPGDVHVFAPGAGDDSRATLRGAGFQLIEASGNGVAGDRDAACAPAWLG